MRKMYFLKFILIFLKNYFMNYNVENFEKMFEEVFILEFMEGKIGRKQRKILRKL